MIPGCLLPCLLPEGSEDEGNNTIVGSPFLPDNMMASLRKQKRCSGTSVTKRWANTGSPGRGFFQIISNLTPMSLSITPSKVTFPLLYPYGPAQAIGIRVGSSRRGFPSINLTVTAYTALVSVYCMGTCSFALATFALLLLNCTSWDNVSTTAFGW